MGYKIFVSYKYKDDSVAYLQPVYSSFGSRTTVRDYVDRLEYILDRSNNIYKGESDNEDLSYLTDDEIWEKLKDRIYDSSVTIVMISPKMKEPHRRSEKSQWIPHEIAYSLRETTRGDRTSHTNAVLAVVLPDEFSEYNYCIEPASYQRYLSNGEYEYGEDRVFSIIRNNTNNRYSYDRFNNFFSSQGVYPISTSIDSYIPFVKWSDFIQSPMRYIEMALNRKEHQYEYNICKEI